MENNKEIRISEMNEKLFKEKMQEMGLLVPASSVFKEQNESWREGFYDGFEKGYIQGRINTYEELTAQLRRMIDEKKADTEEKANEEEKPIIHKRIRLKRGERRGKRVYLYDPVKRIEYEFQSKRSAEKWLGRSNGYIDICVRRGIPITGMKEDADTAYEFREAV